MPVENINSNIRLFNYNLVLNVLGTYLIFVSEYCKLWLYLADKKSIASIRLIMIKHEAKHARTNICSSFGIFIKKKVRLSGTLQTFTEFGFVKFSLGNKQSKVLMYYFAYYYVLYKTHEMVQTQCNYWFL